MFERYFPLMEALRVDLLSRKHQFSSMLYSYAASSMVSLTELCVAFVAQ